MKRALFPAAIATLVLFSLVACGETEPTPSPTSVPLANDEPMASEHPEAGEQPAAIEEPGKTSATYIGLLLFPAEVSEIAGEGPLSTAFIDQKAAAASVDPAQVEHIDSFDSLSFDIEDGARSVVLTTIDFDSESAATDRLGLMSSGMSDLSESIGDASAYMEANEAGIGSMIVFKKGEWVVSLHTAQSDGVSPLVDLEQLTTLARTVADRL